MLTNHTCLSKPCNISVPQIVKKQNDGVQLDVLSMPYSLAVV